MQEEPASSIKTLLPVKKRSVEADVLGLRRMPKGYTVELVPEKEEEENLPVGLEDSGKNFHLTAAEKVKYGKRSKQVIRQEGMDLTRSENALVKKKTYKKSSSTTKKSKFPEAVGAVSKGVSGPCRCAGCLLPPCGSCRFCKDSARFKGPNKLRQRCQLRKCHVGGVKRKRSSQQGSTAKKLHLKENTVRPVTLQKPVRKHIAEQEPTVGLDSSDDSSLVIDTSDYESQPSSAAGTTKAPKTPDVSPPSSPCSTPLGTEQRETLHLERSEGRPSSSSISYSTRNTSNSSQTEVNTSSNSIVWKDVADECRDVEDSLHIHVHISDSEDEDDNTVLVPASKGRSATLFPSTNETSVSLRDSTKESEEESRFKMKSPLAPDSPEVYHTACEGKIQTESNNEEKMVIDEESNVVSKDESAKLPEGSLSVVEAKNKLNKENEWCPNVEKCENKEKYISKLVEKSALEKKKKLTEISIFGDDDKEKVKQLKSLSKHVDKYQSKSTQAIETKKEFVIEPARRKSMSKEVNRGKYLEFSLKEEVWLDQKIINDGRKQKKAKEYKKKVCEKPELPLSSEPLEWSSAVRLDTDFKIPKEKQATVPKYKEASEENHDNDKNFNYTTKLTEHDILSLWGPGSKVTRKSDSSARSSKNGQRVCNLNLDRKESGSGDGKDRPKSQKRKSISESGDRIIRDTSQSRDENVTGNNKPRSTTQRKGEKRDREEEVRNSSSRIRSSTLRKKIESLEGSVKQSSDVVRQEPMVIPRRRKPESGSDSELEDEDRDWKRKRLGEDSVKALEGGDQNGPKIVGISAI